MGNELKQELRDELESLRKHDAEVDRYAAELISLITEGLRGDHEHVDMSRAVKPGAELNPLLEAFILTNAYFLTKLTSYEGDLMDVSAVNQRMAVSRMIRKVEMYRLAQQIDHME